MFKLVPKLIGRGGRNVHDILVETGCVVRIRGQGSGSYKGRHESNEPLQLRMHSADLQGLRKGRDKLAHLFRDICGRYAQFCRKNSVENQARLYTIIGGSVE